MAAPADLKLFNHELKSSFLRGAYFEDEEIEAELNEFLFTKSRLLAGVYSISMIAYDAYEIIDIKADTTKVYKYENVNLIIGIYSGLIFLLLLSACVSFFRLLKLSKQCFLYKFMILINISFFIARMIKLLSITEISPDLKVDAESNAQTLYYQKASINEINVFRATMEGMAFYVYSLKAPLITVILMGLIKSAIYTYFANNLNVLTSQIIFGVIGSIVIYCITFAIKRSNLKNQLEIFVQKKQLNSSNEYYAGFIRDLNYSILTLDKDMLIMNKNNMFDKEFGLEFYYTRETASEQSNFCSTLRVVSKTEAKQNASDEISKSLRCLLGSLKCLDNDICLIQIIDMIYNNHESMTEYNGSNSLPKYNVFKSLGIYYFGVDSKKKFYEVSIRSFFAYKTLVCLDILLLDITQLKLSESKNAEIQVKARMFSKIAHEFKTPLITITSQLERLDEKINEIKEIDFNDNSVNCKYINNLKHIQDISKNTKHLAHYTNFLILDIIQYSTKAKKDIDIKFENVIDIKKEIVSFGQSILDALLSYSTGNKNNIRSNVIWDEEISHYQLFTDKTRFNQILLNLISNAVKFTKGGLVELRCYLRKNEKIINVITKLSNVFEPIYYCLSPRDSSKLPKEFVDLVLSVRDTGNGISKINIESLIAGNSTLASLRDYNNSMGSGLGLGIAKTICGLMNFEFNVTSEEGVGTIFEVVVPLHLRNNVSRIKLTLPRIENNNTCSAKIIETMHNMSSDRSFESIKSSHLKGSQKHISLSPDCSQHLLKDSIILEIPNESQTADLDIGQSRERNQINSFNSTKQISLVTINDYARTFSTASPVKLRNSCFFDTQKLSVNRPVIRDFNDQKSLILICDDSPIILDSTERVLMSIKGIAENYKIIRVEDGANIITTVIENQKNRSLKLVLTDENMEYLNGSQAIKIIKDLEQKDKVSKGVAYISITAFEDEDFKSELLSCGFSKVISKPITKLAISQVLKDLKLL